VSHFVIPLRLEEERKVEARYGWVQKDLSKKSPCPQQEEHDARGGQMTEEEEARSDVK